MGEGGGGMGLQEEREKEREEVRGAEGDRGGTGRWLARERGFNARGK